MQVQWQVAPANVAAQHLFAAVDPTAQSQPPVRRSPRTLAWSELSSPRPAGAAPRVFLVQGLTSAGRPFRPSDWAERLAGALSSFRPPGGGIGAHIGYSPYCVPQLFDDIKCVVVNEALRHLEPMAWDFAINFARDNDLQVVEAGLR